MTDLLPTEVDALVSALDRGGRTNVPESLPLWARARIDTPDGTIWELNTPGRLLAQAYKRIQELERSPVSRVVIDDVRFHICDGTAFRGAPDGLVMGQSSGDWDGHAVFGRGFPHFDFDSPGNQRRHYIVVEAYEGWPDEPESPPEPES